MVRRATNAQVTRDSAPLGNVEWYEHRALGDVEWKSDIYRKFAGEIIAITAVTSAVGIGLMYYVLSGLLDLEAFAGSYSVTPVTAAVTFAVIAGFNLLVGLIPVAVVMRRTPAQILARPDV